jgi:ribosomal protein S8
MNAAISINDFSEHLFWDVDKSKLDFKKSKEQIVYQVVEFGMMKDWMLIQEVYSKSTLKEIVLNLRTIDRTTLSFLAHYFKVDKKQFRCYKQMQSNQGFWGY